MPERQSPVSLITAEHASNSVPERWRALFAGQEEILDTHLARDPGSKDLAAKLAERLEAPLLTGKITRLLVDLNRSASHPRRLSTFSKSLPAEEREFLVQEYWQSHWNAYAQTIERLPGQVVHIACHSFSPILDGKVRTTDIGLLYDPSREQEKAWCLRLQSALRQHLPELKIHMNQPYRGVSNGLGQQHRRLFGDDKLITFELEVNSALLDRSEWGEVERRIIMAIEEISAAGDP